MSQHKKIERKKELDRKRRRREKSLKLRAKEATGKARSARGRTAVLGGP
jgi:hypothetical protein